jgi:mono/diheme cytochrome c family protein
MKRNLTFLLAISAFSLIMILAFMPAQDTWPVPAKAKATPNPVPTDKMSISTGKLLFIKHCSSCHGKTGAGDGTKAPQLKTKLESFKSVRFQSQTDGSLFYKVWEGRKDMPSYKKKLPDRDDVWSIVNFIRTLKPQP